MVSKRSSEKLSRFDATAIVVGSAIGADIYVVTAVSAKMVGPASLLAWVLAGAMAMFIALCFAYCVAMLPKEGGPYAYVKGATSEFPGFMVGWAFLLAEILTLAAFPIAFSQYVHALVPGLPDWSDVAIKVAFVAFVVVTNIVGVKIAGRTNDILTIGKLTPLALIIFGGAALLLANPGMGAAHFSPFYTGDAFGLEQAVVLAFWAYAGFEFATFPADDIEEPEKTIPRALLVGMLVVSAFYLLINLMVIASVPPEELPSGSSPLSSVATSMFSSVPVLATLAPIIVGIGALLSIGGANESGMIGTSRLAYAMSADGLLPRLFARRSARFRTPYLSIVLIGAAILALSLLGGLIALINASVLLMAFGYFATSAAALMLQKKHREVASKLRAPRLIPVAGMVSSAGVALLIDPAQVPVSIILFLAGLPIYRFIAPKKENIEAREITTRNEYASERAKVQERTFLAYALRKARNILRRLRPQR